MPDNPPAPESGDSEVLFRSFSVSGEDFLYDTGTNAVVSLPPEIRPWLDEVVRSREAGKTLERTDRGWSAAHGWVTQAREAGLFAPRPPRNYRGILESEGLRSRLESGMHGLLLGVTDRCNLRCSYCIYSGKYEGHRTHGTSVMSWAVARRGIDFFLARRVEDGTSFVTFYGGEPLLAWTLVEECVRYLRNTAPPGLVLLLNTNLTLMDEEKASFLVQNRVSLTVSVDGPPRAHDAYRRYASGRPTHRKVMAWLEHLRTRYPAYWKEHVLLHATFSKGGDIEAVFDFFSREAFRDLNISVAGVREEEWMLTEEDDRLKAEHRERLENLIQRQREALESGDPFPHRLFQNLFRPVFTRLPQRQIGYAPQEAHPMRTCVPGATRLYVDPNGVLYPCEKTGVSATRIGTLDKGIDLDRVRRLLERQVEFCESNCQHCWAWRLCSLCLTHFLGGGTISEEAMSRRCQEERERVRLSLERFTYLHTHEPPSTWKNPFSLHSAVERAKNPQPS